MRVLIQELNRTGFHAPYVESDHHGTNGPYRNGGPATSSARIERCPLSVSAAALLSRGLIAETTTDIRTKADAALNRIWRNDEDGRANLLRITDAGPSAIGVESAGGDSAPKARTLRTGTKQAKLIEMLRADGGATIDEIVAALQWRPHTVRGALAGALKKRLGLTIVSETVDGRGRIYKIIA